MYTYIHYTLYLYTIGDVLLCINFININRFEVFNECILLWMVILNHPLPFHPPTEPCAPIINNKQNCFQYYS